MNEGFVIGFRRFYLDRERFFYWFLKVLVGRDRVLVVDGEFLVSIGVLMHLLTKGIYVVIGFCAQAYSTIGHKLTGCFSWSRCDYHTNYEADDCPCGERRNKKATFFRHSFYLFFF